MPAPSTAKKPQDRKPAAGTPTKVEVRGIAITIPADALDDFELLDDLNALEEGNATRLPAVLHRLVDKDTYKALMDAVRDPDTGRVTTERGVGLVGEILQAAAPN